MRAKPVLLKCNKCEKTWSSLNHHADKCNCGSYFDVVRLESVTELLIRCDNYTKIIEERK